MRLVSYFIFSLSIIFNSCTDTYKPIEEYLAHNTGAKKADIDIAKDTILIDLHYAELSSMGFDFRTSSVGLMMLDTAQELLDKNGIRQSKIRIHNNNNVTEYSYPIADLIENKKVMEVGSLFMQNFLNGKNEHNARYVDLDKISLEDLFNLNQINEQIQMNVAIEQLTFDGFTLYKDEPENIEFRGHLLGKTESLPFVMQYNKLINKIYYFAINE